MKTEYNPFFEQAISILKILATWKFENYYREPIAEKIESAFVGVVDLTEREIRLIERFEEGFTNLNDQYEKLKEHSRAKIQRLEEEIKNWKEENRDLGNKCERLEEILRDKYLNAWQTIKKADR